jgi:hypothetical protein|tara:strand:+ start:242 stop:460 length:219 start_codon:yes stop_codon:yes gene_type:complete
MSDSQNKPEVPVQFQSESWPVLSEAFIHRLNECFPERSADLSWSEKEIWFASGQRSVARFLNQIFDDQNKIE